MYVKRVQSRLKFARGEQIEVARVKIVNRQREAEGKPPVEFRHGVFIAKRLLRLILYLCRIIQKLLGVLTEAAVAGKRDDYVAKGNGRSVNSAGTGFAYHQNRHKHRLSLMMSCEYLKKMKPLSLMSLS